MTEAQKEAYKKQSAELHERCLYTSTQLLIWLRVLRKIRIAFIILPIVCGSLAGWDLLKAVPEYANLTAALALLAGVIPAIYAALKLDDHLPTATRLAGEYKNLEIIFTDLQNIGLHKSLDEFQAEYREARARLEKANSEAYTAPEWCFRAAQKKIQRGHYTLAESEKKEPDA